MELWVLCARCSAVKEKPRRTFCDACERVVAKRRLQERHVREYTATTQVIRERNQAYKHKRMGVVPPRPPPAKCELCGRGAANLRRALCLDHCHATGKFRGWLCGNCNTGIGKLGDNAQGLHRALAYL